MLRQGSIRVRGRYSEGIRMNQSMRRQTTREVREQQNGGLADRLLRDRSPSELDRIELRRQQEAGADRVVGELDASNRREQYAARLKVWKEQIKSTFFLNVIIDGIFFILLLNKKEAFSDLKVIGHSLWWITVYYFVFALVNILYNIWAIQWVTIDSFQKALCIKFLLTLNSFWVVIFALAKLYSSRVVFF